MSSTDRIRQIDLRGVRFTVEPMDRGQRAFWDKFQSGSWEPETLSILHNSIDRHTTFVDIGSWIGPTALYAACYARRVVALEPDPQALRQLRRNIALNPELAPRIMVLDRALYTKPGLVTLGSKKRGGDSKSSMIFEEMETAWEVPTITPLELAGKLEHEESLFLKIDIEGGEYAILPDIRPILTERTRAVLLSLHPKIFMGRVSGLDRWRRRVELARSTNEMLSAFKGFRAHEARSVSPLRRRDIERLIGWNLCYRGLGGTWLFTRD